MANKYIDSTVLDKAIRFAVQAHANTERRGKGFPYVVHPLEAMAIVATMTSDQELLAAAALHDTVEDTDVTIDELHQLFGERVAELVRIESDHLNGVLYEAGQGDKAATWHARKQATLQRLADTSREAKIVALGDKLSNMRAIYRDYVQQGDELWQSFRVKEKSAHEWYYRGLAEALSELSDTFAYREFVSLVEQVFGS